MQEKVTDRKFLRIVTESKNSKTGRLFQTYSSRSTCPAHCAFKATGGCYGESVRTKTVWDRCDGDGAQTLKDLAAQLFLSRWTTAKPGAVVRHNVAGDMARTGTDDLDEALVMALAAVFKEAKVRAFTYTHCAKSERSFTIAKKAAAEGFIISFSCETAGQCDEVLDAGLPAVLAFPAGEEPPKKTPAGRKVVRCLAQDPRFEGITCEACTLCAKGGARRPVVAFEAHGFRKAAASKKIIEIRAAEA